jgi:hypothetical protein
VRFFFFFGKCQSRVSSQQARGRNQLVPCEAFQSRLWAKRRLTTRLRHLSLYFAVMTGVPFCICDNIELDVDFDAHSAACDRSRFFVFVQLYGLGRSAPAVRVTTRAIPNGLVAICQKMVVEVWLMLYLRRRRFSNCSQTSILP